MNQRIPFRSFRVPMCTLRPMVNFSLVFCSLSNVYNCFNHPMHYVERSCSPSHTHFSNMHIHSWFPMLSGSCGRWPTLHFFFFAYSVVAYGVKPFLSACLLCQQCQDKCCLRDVSTFLEKSNTKLNHIGRDCCLG